jgi:hypothetical protein
MEVAAGEEGIRAEVSHSLDLFVYLLGHRIKESWGRAVVEGMLTGCVPVLPAGHQFHKLTAHRESGFICVYNKPLTNSARQKCVDFRP